MADTATIIQFPGTKTKRNGVDPVLQRLLRIWPELTPDFRESGVALWEEVVAFRKERQPIA
jgi:hypothetical protein